MNRISGRNDLDRAPTQGRMHALIEPGVDTVEGGELWCPSCGAAFSPDLETCPDDGTALVPWLDPVVGSVLDGRFRVERPLAEGATGIVYEAVQLAVERPVAIKVIRAHCVHDPSIKQRFLREVRVLTSFRHPNVVDVYDYGELPDGRPYMVMELVRGETLDHVLARSQRMGIVDACQIALALCDVLAAAHDHGVVHRDLKPANIMFDAERGLVKVLDFGLAKSFVADDDVTKVGILVGTPLYMPPEVIANSASDPRSDLYSLGCVIYELLAGESPFSGTEVADVLARQLDEAPPPLPDSVPSELCELVHALLAKSPDLRPPSARAVRERIESVLAADAEPTVPRPTIEPLEPPAARRDLWILCGMLALGIALFCVVAFL